MSHPNDNLGLDVNLSLDLRVGGNGDNWMRLVGLFTAVALRPERRVECVFSPMLRTLASHIFGDRLRITDTPTRKTLSYENKGVKDLVPRAVRGERFIVPYHRGVTRDWNTGSLKDRINVALFSGFNTLDWLQLPPWSVLELYQGYLEIVSVAALRDIAWEEFLAAGKEDFALIYARMNENLPLSAELQLPADIGSSTVIFPSGTGHQFMPLSWAQRHLPDAYYCFFARDKEQEPFRAAGLKVLNFHREPGDIVEIARRARRAVSTDSFASHLLQYSVEHSVLTLAEFPRGRVVTPFFRGVIIDSAAPCSPCPHLERSGYPHCKSGYYECLTWQDAIYTQRVLEAVA